MIRILPLLALAFVFQSCKKTDVNMALKNITPPSAEKIEKVLEIHGDKRIDNYFWLNDKEDPKVIDYLEKENTYFDKMTNHYKDFEEDLFEEMKSRIKEDDNTVPFFDNGYYYISKYEKGKEYPIHVRKKGSLDAEEEVLFDVNEMAEGFEYFRLGSFSISPDNKRVAFSVDTLSRRLYTIKIKDLETGKELNDEIKNTSGSSAWADDNKTIFYTGKNENTLRSEKIMKHKIGSNINDDKLMFNEEDTTFSTWVYRSKSGKYIISGSGSTLSNEYRVLKTDNPDGEFKTVISREKIHEYSIYHHGDSFYILTNDKAENFKLVKAPVNNPSRKNWVEIIPHRKDTLIEEVEIFEDYLVVGIRNDGLFKINISPLNNKDESFYIPFEEEAYSASIYSNPNMKSSKVRFYYSSFTVPGSVIEFDMKTKEREILKENEVMGGKFDKNNYVSKRIWVEVRDGEKVAVSMVRRKETKVNDNTPLLLYAYGSYGHTIDASFSTTRLSLLDRGFVYAVAHVRGSEYLGRKWYEDGKMKNKLNTFYDFIDVSKYLIENKLTSSKHLYAYGGSAGGLLMGAIINLAPELYNGVIAAVPFVDVITTMLDETIPLTTFEFDEWGNPKIKEEYDYIKRYSPYDNVEAKGYPNLLVTTGLHDSQVQYWEPAKWVAKLRELKTNDNKLLLHTDMDSGHGGASGRFKSLKDVAQAYSFIINLE